MTKPLVAIVGRPNVGKSTFFNRLAGNKISIVDDKPGVTRDRIYADVEWLNYKFTLIDTGGLEVNSDDIILKQMKKQAEIAIETSDLILFFADIKEGVTPADREVCDFIRKTNKKVLLVVNKADKPKVDPEYYDFYNLGIGDPIAISAAQGLGIGDLLDEIVKNFPDPDDQEDESGKINIAVVGKPNVGKSSLVNYILKEERSIVSDIPGTTRDAIDTPFEYKDREMTIIDTAGIRRKNKIDDETIERYSVIRSFNAIRRCDVAVMVIDAKEGISEQDSKIAGFVHEEGKGCIVVVNKWDAIEKDTKTVEKYKAQINEQLGFMTYAPIIFISAKTGLRVDKLMDSIIKIYENSNRRITTGVLNDVLGDAVTIAEPPSDKGKRLKLFYCTQVSIKPPTFIIFVNDVKLFHFSYKRYIENYFRKTFDLEGTPIHFIYRERNNQGGI